MTFRANKHREAINTLRRKANKGGYSGFVLDRWHHIGSIPLIFIPDVAYQIGWKPSELSNFYKKPMIMIGE